MITNLTQRDLRGKALILYKESLPCFTQVQHDILIGTLLGDASMQAMKGAQESNIKFEQSIAQLDYIDHLYSIFRD